MTNARYYEVDAPWGRPSECLVVRGLNSGVETISFARDAFGQLKSKESARLTRAAGYVLFDAGTTLPSRLYVGHADPLVGRIPDHLRSRSWWTRCAYVGAADGVLNRAHVAYIETELVQLARRSNAIVLDNAVDPKPRELSARERHRAEQGLTEFLGHLDVLGLNRFSWASSVPIIETDEEFVARSFRTGFQADGWERAPGRFQNAWLHKERELYVKLRRSKRDPRSAEPGRHDYYYTLSDMAAWAEWPTFVHFNVLTFDDRPDRFLLFSDRAHARVFDQHATQRGDLKKLDIWLKFRGADQVGAHYPGTDGFADDVSRYLHRVNVQGVKGEA